MDVSREKRHTLTARNNFSNSWSNAPSSGSIFSMNTSRAEAIVRSNPSIPSLPMSFKSNQSTKYFSSSFNTSLSKVVFPTDGGPLRIEREGEPENILSSAEVSRRRGSRGIVDSPGTFGRDGKKYASGGMYHDDTEARMRRSRCAFRRAFRVSTSSLRVSDGY